MWGDSGGVVVETARIDVAGEPRSISRDDLRELLRDAVFIAAPPPPPLPPERAPGRGDGEGEFWSGVLVGAVLVSASVVLAMVFLKGPPNGA
jgi:hypothetical protein